MTEILEQGILFFKILVELYLMIYPTQNLS